MSPNLQNLPIGLKFPALFPEHCAAAAARNSSIVTFVNGTYCYEITAARKLQVHV
jgi:hypothetical protein